MRMKRRPIQSLLWALVLLLAGPTVLSARQVALTIVHTTDLHGHVLPTHDYDGTEGLGGLLRCATVIERLREEEPNLLLVDCGDLYQGGMESFMSGGRIMNDALAWLGYDAWVIGNHEFDWGLDALVEAVNGSTVTVLGANVGVRPGADNPLSNVKPFVIREVDGIRVALVGLTTDAIPNWSRPNLLGDVAIADSVATLREVLPQVRTLRPDVMVLLVHQGYRPFGDSAANQVNRIADHFPEFDLIIGGHSHQPVGDAEVNGVLYAQAGYYGIWLGKARLIYDTVARRIVEREGQLIHVADAYEPHEGLRDALRKDLDRAEQAAAAEIGLVTGSLTPKSRMTGQSGIQELFCRAMADAVDAEVVLHGVLSDQTLDEGPVYEKDIWRMVPYENSIGTLLITVAELQEILENNVDVMGRSSFMGVYGIQYDLHEYAEPGRRVRNVRLADGSPIHPRKRLRVAMNSYVLASGGARFPAARRLADDPVTRLDMTGIDTRSAVRDYIRKHSPVSIEVRDAVRHVRSPE